jgi:DNA primase
VYSIRPTADARVSSPLLWDEVPATEPDAFTVETMPARIEAVGDPMHGMWKSPPSLLSRFDRLDLEPPS